MEIAAVVSENVPDVTDNGPELFKSSNIG